MSYTIRKPHCSGCETFAEGYGSITGSIFIDAVHGGRSDMPEFQFCPWCGAKLTYTEKIYPGTPVTLDKLGELLKDKSEAL